MKFRENDNEKNGVTPDETNRTGEGKQGDFNYRS